MLGQGALSQALHSGMEKMVLGKHQKHHIFMDPKKKTYSQLRWLFPIYGKIQAMFQTTRIGLWMIDGISPEIQAESPEIQADTRTDRRAFGR